MRSNPSGGTLYVYELRLLALVSSGPRFAAKHPGAGEDFGKAAGAAGLAHGDG
jgi:hypothetical protein